jgi:hypothetical protein
MRTNTHLSPEQYIDEDDLGDLLTEELNHAASEALGHDAVVVFFNEGRSGLVGYEVREGDRHVRIDGGHANVLEAIIAFDEWCERESDDEDDLDDDEPED